MGDREGGGGPPGEYKPKGSEVIAGKVERAPEGWLNNNELSKKLNTRFKTILRIAKTYQVIHPEWFQDYRDNKNKTLTFYSPELVEAISEKVREEKLPAPAGWLTIKRLLREAGALGGTAEKIIERHKPLHPEWFRFFNKQEYAHPDLVDLINKELEGQQHKAPGGWQFDEQLILSLNLPKRTIRLLAERYRAIHPEWFYNYIGYDGKLHEHYDPQLVGAIQNDCKTPFEKAPPGWMNKNQLSKPFSSATDSVIERIVRTYRTSNPEWFKNFLDATNKITEFFHPDLIALIKQEIANRVEAPNGWMTNGALATEEKVSFSVVARIAKSYREDHPDWFRVFLDKKRENSEHYHPDLVALIKAELQKFEYPPEGWMVSMEVGKLLKVNYAAIQRRASAYRESHPEWFKQFREKSKMVMLEYYHPDLIAQIKKDLEIKAESAPSGWATIGGMATQTGAHWNTIGLLADGYKKLHPEWFKEYFDPASNKTTLFLSPDLVLIIKAEMSRRKESTAPDGWMSRSGLSKLLHVTHDTVHQLVESQRDQHPEWLQDYFDEAGKLVEFLSPELIEFVKKSIAERGEVAPKGWMTKSGIARKLKTTDAIVSRIAEPCRETNPDWFIEYLVPGKNHPAEFFHPNLVTFVKDVFYKRGQPAPEGWQVVKSLRQRFGIDPITIGKLAEQFRAEHPDWFHNYLDASNNLRGFFHPELIAKLGEIIEKMTKSAPEGWQYYGELAQSLQVMPMTVKRRAETHRVDHPNWVGSYWKKDISKMVEYYHPDLIALIISEIGGWELAPPGWLTVTILAGDLGIGYEIVKQRADIYRSEHPEWFKNYVDAGHKLSEYYSPELIKKIKEDLKERIYNKENAERELNLKRNLEIFVQDVASGESDPSKIFRALLTVFGASHCLDILYKFRPGYKGLPPDYVKGTIADYLGDFLSVKGEFNLNDLEYAVDYLSDATFQEGLYETIKDNCLRYYFTERRRGLKDSSEIIYGYLGHITDAVANLSNKNLDDVIEKVILYYDSVLKDFHKPEQFVEALSEDREFPDINQRINMKELSDKRRLLIADEMGLGKSASVIMAKEQLGVKTALIVAPSNVVETWNGYLSEDGEGGYFQNGKGPRILKVEDPEQLTQINGTTYDYILISQERLSERYMQLLQSIDYDMLIADEIHKMKSLEGVRTENIIGLAQKVHGENKYLALLSGTPVPNKIEDVALILKLLYPEKFSDIDNRELVFRIIHGDIVDLRSLLVPRMQMKSLEEGVEMPPLYEEDIEVELTDLEKEIYDVLLEDDELTATDKMKLLRQFILNPETIDSTPGIESAKISELNTSLSEAFSSYDKVVVFVNDYIEGIIRGKSSILEKLDLPSDVTVRVIHGETKKEDRLSFQSELNEQPGRMLLFVSGQTADVGVDFTGADELLFYNEPWTEYQKRQELARAYRPGLEHELKSKTLIAPNTIEQGMHEYIRRKYIAVEKLLRGIPITELEQELLTKDEKSKDPDLSVNPELAEYYFSSWDKMMKIFGYVKELGEEDFKKFLSKYSRDYASGYVAMGNRSYQANANRIAGTVIHEMAKEAGQDPKQLKIIDLASGPEMLRQHIGDGYERAVFSVDLNREHFVGREDVRGAVGSLAALPFAGEAFDYANLSLSLHYTGFVPSRGQLERLQVLSEMNRVLKLGGKVVLNLIYSLELKNFDQFREAINVLGFKIVDSFTGEVEVGSQYKSQVITLEKTNSLDPNIKVDDLSDELGKEKREGLKFTKSDARIKNSRQIVTDFELGGKHLDVNFNQKDRTVWEEEQGFIAQGEQLKLKYENISKIPAKEIVENNFVRIRIGEKYILFKKLTKGSGVVIIK